MTLAWLILWIPFLAAAGILLFALKRPQIAAWLSTGAVLFCFLLSAILFIQFVQQGGSDSLPLESSINWIVGSITIEFGLLLNGLSVLMLLIVTGIGSLIFLYSMEYMHHDESQSRYFASLSLFAFSMLGIVLSNNLIQIFIFWELVGLSSYLLIGFWYQKPEAATAGKKAFLTTRVGDVGMMIGILMLFGYLAQNNMATFNFLSLESLADKAHPFSIGKIIPASALTIICLLIFLGVVGKSAQLPLHVWLPDAMEGPTPVSALIHAATMVAAGVFLLARLFFLFHLSHTALIIISWIGVLTAFMAGLIAIVQNDIKKILAYSTLSQLGYMVMAMGLSAPDAGMFHLTTHAFFKALLFLGSGSFIHALHTQDIWQIRSDKSLLQTMPVTSYTFLIGTAALMGIPPLSGFFSKEEILAAAQHGHWPIFILALATVFLTAFYMGRLITVLFLSKSKSSTGHAHGHEAGWKITIPLMMLGFFSILGGFLPIKKTLPDFDLHLEAHHGFPWLAIISTLLGLIGFGVAWYLYRFSNAPESNQGVKKILEKKFFFDDFYDTVVIRGFQENVAKMSDATERHVMVDTAMNGTARLIRNVGDWLRQLQIGIVQFYVFAFVLGLSLMLYYFILAD